MSLIKAKPPKAETFTLADAEAAVENARRERYRARDSVDDAVADFPEGMRDRRVIVAMTSPRVPSDGMKYLQNPDLKAAFDRKRVFDEAITAEGVAERKLGEATAARDELRAVTEAAALGDGRQALAEAIATHAATVKVAAGYRTAVERARGALVAAQTKHSLAESALAEARERAIGAVTAADGVQPPELKQLRRDVADTADDVEIAAAALARAELWTADPDFHERKAREAVEAAADAVISVCAQRAWNEVETARAEMKRREAVFAAVAGHVSTAMTPETRILKQRRAEMVFSNDEVSQRARASASYAWKAAHAALLEDPQAPLPEIG